MHFKLKTSILDIDISTDEKYIFISGFSGAGKSMMIEEISRVIRTEGNVINIIQSDIEYHLVENNDNLNTMDLYVRDEKPCLFIADEFYANKLATRIEGKNACCLCVTRNTPKNINFSYKCLYKAYRDSTGVTRVEPDVNLTQVDLLETYDKILTEDTKGGYQYITHLIDKIKVESVGGKSNFKNFIKVQPKACNMLLFIDAAGIGSEIKRIQSECRRRRKSGAEVHLIMPECFEQILVESKLLEKVEHGKFSYTDNNLETFYEKEIEHLTKGTPLEYNHKRQRLSDCWLEDCSNCDRGCVYRVPGAKARAVIGNGECADLLKFAKEGLI